MAAVQKHNCNQYLVMSFGDIGNTVTYVPLKGRKLIMNVAVMFYLDVIDMKVGIHGWQVHFTCLTL